MTSCLTPPSSTWAAVTASLASTSSRRASRTSQVVSHKQFSVQSITVVILGVDYSRGAIELAKKIAEKEECGITFDTLDILDEQSIAKFSDKFQVIVDKGTFDAISLSESAARDKELYVRHSSLMMAEGALLLLTSCNWTESELVTHFSSLCQVSRGAGDGGHKR